MRRFFGAIVSASAASASAGRTSQKNCRQRWLLYLPQHHLRPAKTRNPSRRTGLERCGRAVSTKTRAAEFLTRQLRVPTRTPATGKTRRQVLRCHPTPWPSVKVTCTPDGLLDLVAQVIPQMPKLVVQAEFVGGSKLICVKRSCGCQLRKRRQRKKETRKGIGDFFVMSVPP